MLDPAAIDQISAESWPEARDADELHDALLTLMRMPPVDEWRGILRRTCGNGRASTIARERICRFGSQPNVCPLPTMRMQLFAAGWNRLGR